MACGERMSGLIASAWPSLMKKGPRDVRISRSFRVLVTSFFSMLPVIASSRRGKKKPDAAVATCTSRASTMAGRLL
eukprot:749597-Hanusia_phi.AAC.9